MKAVERGGMGCCEGGAGDGHDGKRAGPKPLSVTKHLITHTLFINHPIWATALNTGLRLPLGMLLLGARSHAHF